MTCAPRVVLLTVLVGPGVVIGDDVPSGVWQRTIPRGRITETWAVTPKGEGGEIAVSVQYVQGTRELAAYNGTRVTWDANRNRLEAELRLEHSPADWPRNVGFTAVLASGKLVSTPAAGTVLRGGELTPVEDPGARFLGDWIATDTGHEYQERWTIGRDEEGAWSATVVYRLGGTEKGRSHGKAFTFDGATLRFETVIDVKPRRNWTGTADSVRVVGTHLRMQQRSGGRRGVVLLRRVAVPKSN